MQIKKSEFIKSSAKVEQCPQTPMPEYAFIGRSNVGKSSLINMITGRRKLASTSSAPGKTRLINHFLIDDAWYIADLPGYGYAKRSKSERKIWKLMTNEYFINRDNLTCVFILLDSRRDPLEQDLEFMDYIGSLELPFVMIFTKTDKVGKQRISELKTLYEKSMSENWEFLPDMIYTSAANKNGKSELLDFIHQTNISYNQER